MEGPFRTLCVALSALLIACSSPDAKEPRAEHPEGAVVSLEVVRIIEASVTMPQAARPLHAYDRYYAMERIGDRTFVRGVFLLRRAFGGAARSGMEAITGQSNVYRGASSDLPIIADGGCAVVTVFFDPLSSQFVPVEAQSGDQSLSVCNGLA